MSITQNIFNIQIKTTNTKINEQTIAAIINKAIEKSEYSSDLTYKFGKTDTAYDFKDNIEMFYAFLKYSKNQFFEKYPYLTQEEYDLTLSVFNKDAVNILINFIENTSTQVLAEPYNLTSTECKQVATAFAKEYFSPKQFEEFADTAIKRGINLY